MAAQAGDGFVGGIAHEFLVRLPDVTARDNARHAVVERICPATLEVRWLTQSAHDGEPLRSALPCRVFVDQRADHIENDRVDSRFHDAAFTVEGSRIISFSGSGKGTKPTCSYSP